MRINKTVWLIMGILIPVVIIINVYIVWSNIEAQKEKLKEFRFQQNPNRALSDRFLSSYIDICYMSKSDCDMLI